MVKRRAWVTVLLSGAFVAALDALFHTVFTSPPEVFGYYLVLFLAGMVGGVVVVASRGWRGLLLGAVVFVLLKGAVYYYANATSNMFLTCCTYQSPLMVFGVSNYWFSVAVEGAAHFLLFLVAASVAKEFSG